MAFGLAFELADRLMTGLIFGLVTGVAGGLVTEQKTKEVRIFGQPGSASLTPRASWQRERRFGLIIGPPCGLAFGLVVVLLSRPAGGQTAVLDVVEFELAVGVALGVSGGVIFPETWPASLAIAQLAKHWPVNLMRFLVDARDRGILRTFGPVYQFRHARLQDRLATQRHQLAAASSEPAALGIRQNPNGGDA